ncbi:MAG: 16S rRNA (cytosine(1402)-N(4))-methyltransferase RsmH [bacterium]
MAETETSTLEHKPVLLKEVVEFLQVKPGGVYVDGTVGGGGHAKAILERMGEKGIYVAIDRDSETLEATRDRLKVFGDRVRFVHGVFSEIPRFLESLEVKEVDGVLLDLGISSFQLDRSGRGFSFGKEGPLDMRMDPLDSELLTAADLVNDLPEQELEEIFKKFGEERFARRIARAIVSVRRRQPFLKTVELARLIERTVPPPFRPPRARIHPATKVFQALRIAVNGELDHLSRFLGFDFGFLKRGGRVAVISFHSLEDRLVKRAFRSREDFRVITKRPVEAEEEERIANPRSRSAKLRIAEKIK